MFKLSDARPGNGRAREPSRSRPGASAVGARVVPGRWHRGRSAALFLFPRHGPRAERSSLRISSDNFEKASRACEDFRCVPYFAIVVDAGEKTQGFLLPMEHLLKLYSEPGTGINWKMGERSVKGYMDDPMIKMFELQTTTSSWW